MRTLQGATGGGYVLSKGVVSKASLMGSGEGGRVSTIVNGDPTYDARTTRRALSLLVRKYGLKFGHVQLDQSVDVPIGAGFGASAASALSAVYSVAALLGVDDSRKELARCAHDAEIVEQTGLGTVSVIYEGIGAGAITEPGIPGVARFMNVEVPADTRIVTAVRGSYDKRDAISSPSLSEMITRLGDEALRRLCLEPTLDNLARAGEWFSDGLGLESSGVKQLEKAALAGGAAHASQNMIGHAIHALTNSETAPSVFSSLKRLNGSSRVDLFEIGSVPAGPV